MCVMLFIAYNGRYKSMLWEGIMKCKEKNWFIENNDYRDNLNVIYNKVESIHEHSKSYYFTDHSRKHSDRIAESLVHLFPFLFFGGKDDIELNDVEKFILFASILLHDIGIRIANLDLLSYIVKKYGIKGTFDEETKLDFIRDHHHTLSKCWIKENVDIDNTKLPILYSGNKVLAKYIGYVAESHGIDFEDKEEYTEVTAYGSERIRMGLLCTLLSLGDALDCDQRRINYDLLKVSDLSTESRLHWMKHYFVDGVVLTPNLIEIYYSFPKMDKNSEEIYQNYFVNKTKYWIEKCFTVRGKFLFPVGAICRVVDIVHFNDDKDELKDKEFLEIQNKYVDEILKEGNKYHLHFVKYLVGIVTNDKNEFLYLDPSNSFNIHLMYDDKSQESDYISKHWETVLKDTKSGWNFVGKVKNSNSNSIYCYYEYQFDEKTDCIESSIKHEWLNLEEYLRKNNDIFIKKYYLNAK